MPATKSSSHPLLQRLAPNQTTVATYVCAPFVGASAAVSDELMLLFVSRMEEFVVATSFPLPARLPLPAIGLPLADLPLARAGKLVWPKSRWLPAPHTSCSAAQTTLNMTPDWICFQLHLAPGVTFLPWRRMFHVLHLLLQLERLSSKYTVH